MKQIKVVINPLSPKSDHHQFAPNPYQYIIKRNGSEN